MDTSYMNRAQIERKMDELAARADVRFAAGFFLGLMMGGGLAGLILFGVSAWSS